MATKRTKAKYAEVAPAVPLSGKVQTYTYALPRVSSKQQVVSSKREEFIRRQVKVPLGKRIVSGVIVDVHDKKPPARIKTKELTLLDAKRLTKEQVTFARWIAQTMQGGLGFTLKLFLPPLTRGGASATADAEGFRRRKPPLPRLSGGKLTQLHYAVVDSNTTRRQKNLLKLAKKVLARGQQVLILIPENVLLAGWQAVLPKSLAVHPHLVIGTQNKLFAPWQSLGLIIIDEAAYETHKQWDRYPRLDTRDGARKLAEIHDCSLLYSSSFSSVGLEHEISTGGVVKLEAKNHTLAARLVSSSFQDRKRRYLIPHEALTMLRSWLKKKEHVFILFNRTDKSRVMKVLRAEFPQQDWSGLIGTTAAFKDVVPTGVDRAMLLLPELSLRYPDFRSAERTRGLVHRLQQLLPARRKVVLVTRDQRLVEERLALPERAFMAAERKDRKRLSYPPFVDMVKLTFQATSEKKAHNKALKAREEIESRYHPRGGNGKPKLLCNGPFADLKPPRGKKYESHLLLRGDLEQLTPLYDGLKADIVDLSPERIL